MRNIWQWQSAYEKSKVYEEELKSQHCQFSLCMREFNQILNLIFDTLQLVKNDDEQK